ncbi:MAG TPA: serine/threonine-protein kinase [Polyangia bacterium]|nr:serine/threonine-protein kinase [Polyangia bacterium]
MKEREADAPAELAAPTVADSPAARSEERTTLAHGSSRGTSAVHSATAMRALRAEELLRARGFGRVIALLCLFALGPVLLMARALDGRARWPHVMMASSLASCGLVAAWVWAGVRTTRSPKRMMRVFGLICLVHSLVVQYYAGVFSPAPAVIALGISYFGLADDRAFSYFMCVSASICYGVLACLVAFGAVPDPALFPARDAPVVLRMVAIGTALAVFGVMFWQARLSRNATHEAVERLDEALRLVQQREALLEEANQDLDAALAAGAGRRGLYTGRIVGQWLLSEVLGRGGMGEVYAAQHAETRAEAAIKLLHGRALANPAAVERFLREAELALSLRAPNLVEIYELGQADDGAPFIAMEKLAGHDLGWHLRRKRQLPLAELVELARQIAEGLSAAHRAGVVHRDLKPANLFLVEKPGDAVELWKILDFGVAKLRGSTGTLTQRAIIGTPGYMSPEQAQGREVDPRSDLFSLGAVLYRSLTGRPAFSGPDMPQILFDIVYRSPTRPSEIVPGLPRDVDLVLAIALAKNPDERFHNPPELATAFDAASRNELSRSQRARGAELVRVLPWGQTIKPKG